MALKPQLGMDQLFKKFNEFRTLDSRSDSLALPQQPLRWTPKPPKEEVPSAELVRSPLEDLITTNQIIAKIRRINPYLQDNQGQETEPEHTFRNHQDDLLCQVLMKQNQRLCSKFVEKPQLNEIKGDSRKPGCVFEVVFSFQEIMPQLPSQDKPLFQKEKLTNGFVAVTEILEFYQSLGETVPVISYRFKDLEYVHYYEDSQYDYIRIKTTLKQKMGWINIGFISKKRIQIFDQMMFLAYQLNNTNPGRLFNNNLLADNFKKY